MPRDRAQDARVVRTKAQLRAALLDLIAEQELPAITVTDITQRAGINRNTFYRHYLNKEEIIEDTLDDLFLKLTAASREFLASHGPLSPTTVPPPTIALFHELNRRPALFTRLLGNPGSSEFVFRLRTFYERQFTQIWEDLGLVAERDSPPVDLRAAFAGSSMESIIRWWLTAGQDVSPDQVSLWVWQLLSELWFQWQACGTPDQAPVLPVHSNEHDGTGRKALDSR